MTKPQWDAFYDYCAEFGYTSQDVLKALKSNGAIAADAKLKDLGDYTSGTTYDDMMNFLEENL